MNISLYRDVSNNIIREPLTAKSVFIEDLENAYQTYSIYRAIVVTDVNKEIEYQIALEENNHTALVVSNIDYTSDYENIDARVLIMNYDTFDTFIDYISNKYDLSKSSYNLMAFTYDIDEKIRYDLTAKYHELNKYSDDTIII